MKYYQKLVTIAAFTLFEASKIIGNKALASKYLYRKVIEGTIHRVKRNLYTCVNFATGDDYANRFEIASKIMSDSFISFHSAFEFYGFYNQSYYIVQVCSSKRFMEFDYNDYHYKSYITNSREQIDVIQGVRVASIERTIVDSINMIGKVMDVEELVKCLDLIHRVKEEKILEMLRIYDKEILYRKVGYVLSFYKEEFSLSSNFFNECKKKGVLSNKGYFVLKKNDYLVFNSEWGLYSYKDLRKLTSKGGEIDV